MTKTPNILFIISDQHNAKVFGHKDDPNAITPNLDRLAADGVRFDNAICQNPICTPSRVSFLSGQYAHNHGYYGLGGPNPGGLPTILGHFRRAGYLSGAVGKIHCPEYWVEDDVDFFREVSGGCSIGGSPEYYQHLRDNGLYETWQSEQYTNPYGGQCYDGIPSKLDYRDSEEGFTVTEIIKFMQQAVDEDKPFIIQASFPKPHQLYVPSQEFWDLYDEEDLTLPPNADYDMAGKAPNLIAKEKEWRRGEWAVFEPKTYEAARLRKLHGYLGCITQVDYAVGELLAWLEGTGLENDTIVIYTSDHGDYACEHGIMEKAPGICSDAITRIPSIWRWPQQIKSNHVATELVEAVDLATTLCRLAGIDPLQTSDGKDITHLLRGEAGDVRDIAVTEFDWSKSVRKGQYRLVYYPPEMFAEEYPGGFGELYDLEADPWEMENLYFSSEFPVELGLQIVGQAIHSVDHGGRATDTGPDFVEHTARTLYVMPDDIHLFSAEMVQSILDWAISSYSHRGPSLHGLGQSFKCFEVFGWPWRISSFDTSSTCHDDSLFCPASSLCMRSTSADGSLASENDTTAVTDFSATV